MGDRTPTVDEVKHAYTQARMEFDPDRPDLEDAEGEFDRFLQVTRERDIDAAARALYEHEHIGTKREPNWDGEAAKHVQGVWRERVRVVLDAAKK